MRTFGLVCTLSLLVTLMVTSLPTTRASLELDFAEAADAHIPAIEDVSLDQLISVPFDPENDPRDKELYDIFRSSEGFLASREARAKLDYHMNLEEYDQAHEQSRMSLLSMAESLHIPFELHKDNFHSVMSRIDEAMTKDLEVAAFVDRTELTMLKSSMHLFATRTTLHKAEVEDALRWGLPDGLSKAINWVKTYVKNNKCNMCVYMAKWIKTKACVVAGTAVCAALATAAAPITGGLTALISKYVCGWPINLGVIFGGWCSKAISFIQGRLDVSDRCLCSFQTPPINFPRIVGGGSITIGGLCSVPAGSCAWHDKAAKETYTKENPKEKLTDLAKRKYTETKTKIQNAGKATVQFAKDMKEDPKKAILDRRQAIGKAAGKTAEWVGKKALAYGANKVVGKAVGKLDNMGKKFGEKVAKHSKQLGKLVNSDKMKKAAHFVGDSVVREVSKHTQAAINKVTSQPLGRKVATMTRTVLQKDGVDKLKRQVSNKVNNVKNKVTTTAQNLKNRASNKVNNLKTQATAKFNKAKSQVTSKVNNLKQKATNKVNTLKTQATNKFNTAKAKVTNKVNTLKQKATNKINNMKAKVTNKVNNVKARVTNKVNNAKARVTNKVNNVKARVTAVRQRTRAAVRKTTSFLRRVGSNIRQRARAAVRRAPPKKTTTAKKNVPAKKTATTSKKKLTKEECKLKKNANLKECKDLLKQR